MNVQSAGNGGREQSEDVSGSDNVDQYGQGQEVVGIEQAGNEEEDQSEIPISLDSSLGNGVLTRCYAASQRVGK